MTRPADSPWNSGPVSLWSHRKSLDGFLLAAFGPLMVAVGVAILVTGAPIGFLPVGAGLIAVVVTWYRARQSLGRVPSLSGHVRDGVPELISPPPVGLMRYRVLPLHSGEVEIVEWISRLGDNLSPRCEVTLLSGDKRTKVAMDGAFTEWDFNLLSEWCRSKGVRVVPERFELLPPPRVEYSRASS